MTTPTDSIRTTVRDTYARIASTGGSCCAPEPQETAASVASCCPPATDEAAVAGNACCVEEAPPATYDAAELEGLPDEALMGLGCGNPVALADIAEGETVLDLGSGGGIDVFLAARRTGPTGRVIGVDMTPEMLQRAERNAVAAGVENTEFREGIIENLPVDDGTVDVILSNCVINLAPDKEPVFREAFRVLRSGGRIVVSDIVRSGVAPTAIDPASWASCVDGALPLDDYLAAVRAAGFDDVAVLTQTVDGEVFSATIGAVKP